MYISTLFYYRPTGEKTIAYASEQIQTILIWNQSVNSNWLTQWFNTSTWKRKFAQIYFYTAMRPLENAPRGRYGPGFADRWPPIESMAELKMLTVFTLARGTTLFSEFATNTLSAKLVPFSTLYAALPCKSDSPYMHFNERGSVTEE